MGLLDKIEEKFSHKKEPQGADSVGQDGTTSTGEYSSSTPAVGSSTTSSRQNPIGSAGTTHGTGLTGGTTHGSSGLTGNHSTTHSNVPGTYPSDNTTSILPDRSHHTTTTHTPGTTTSSSDLTGHNTSSALPGSTSNQTYGTSNQTYGASNTLKTGPHSELENRDAIPVAGGERIGSTGAAYESRSQGYPEEYGSGSTNTAHGSTTGPHRSEMLNKLDPRVETDSSRAHDGRTTGLSDSTRQNYDGSSSGQNYGRDATLAGGAAGAGSGIGSSHHRDQPLSSDAGFSDRHTTTGSSGLTGTTSDSRNTAPHNSSLMNKLDPRVETGGTSSNTSTSHGPGYTSNTGFSDRHNTSSNDGYAGTTSDGRSTAPHNSSMLNKLDPRVETGSQGTNTSTSAYGQGNSSSYGTQGNTSSYGAQGNTSSLGSSSTTTDSRSIAPHNSSLMNKLDPRVETGSQGTNTSTSAYEQGNTSSYGTQGNTASSYGQGNNSSSLGSGSTTSDSRNTAPHNSSLMNKLDPRVDTNNPSTSSGSGLTGGTSSSTTTGGLFNKRHANYDTARSAHGGGSYGSGHEQGYDRGYADALEHIESERRAGRY